MNEFTRPSDPHLTPIVAETPDLRDYFAAKAMQALLTGVDIAAGGLYPTDLAGYAYRYADAMLKARSE